MYVILIDNKPYKNESQIRTYKTITTANREVTRLIKTYSRYWLKAGTVIKVAEFAFTGVISAVTVEAPEDRSVPHAQKGTC